MLRNTKLFSFNFNTQNTTTTTTTTQPTPPPEERTKTASSKELNITHLLPVDVYPTRESAQILIAKYCVELQQTLKHSKKVSSGQREIAQIVHNALKSMTDLIANPSFAPQFSKDLDTIDPRYFLLHQTAKLLKATPLEPFFAEYALDKKNALVVPLAMRYGQFSSLELQLFIEVIVSQSKGLLATANLSNQNSAKLKRSNNHTPYSILALPQVDPLSPLHALMEKVGVGAFKVVKYMVPLSGHSDHIRAYSTPNKESLSQENLSTFRVNNLLFQEEELISQLKLHDAQHCIDMQTVILNGKAHGVSTLCNSGTLNNLLGKNLPLKIRLGLAQQLAHDLVIMHQKSGMAHYDLKAENLFLHVTNNVINLKIGDFGTAEKLLSDKNEPKLTYGYPTYPPPEVKPGKQQPVSTAVDLWCLGILLYQLKYDSQTEIFELGHLNVHKKAYYNCLRRIIGECLESNTVVDRLIIDLLDEDPEMRPSALQVLTILNEQLILLNGLHPKTLVN